MQPGGGEGGGQDETRATSMQHDRARAYTTSLTPPASSLLGLPLSLLPHHHLPRLFRVLYPVPIKHVFTMSGSMKAYLAAKYMTGPKADAILARTDTTKKKKKRKAGASAASGSSIIKDDDLSGWAEPPKEDDEGEDIDADASGPCS